VIAAEVYSMVVGVVVGATVSRLVKYGIIGVCAGASFGV
jgi:hypothetical protein